MSRTEQKGPRLPKGILDQVGGTRQKYGNRNHSTPTRFNTGKVGSKAPRLDSGRSRTHSASPWRSKQSSVEHGDFSGFSDTALKNNRAQVASVKGAKVTQKAKPAASPRDDVKRVVPSRLKESSTPPPVPRAVKEKLAEDDADIAALEKRLGIKSGQKTSKGLQEDGLDFLLDGLGEPKNDTKRKRDEYDEYLQNKRRTVSAPDSSSSVEDDGSAIGDDDEWGLSSDDDSMEHSAEGDEGAAAEDDALGWSSNKHSDNESNREETGSTRESKGDRRKRENPYVPPITDDESGAAKYVPPSLRQATGPDADDLARVKRQVQGLLNRLSEANSITIVRDIERLYQLHPRQHVTTAVADILLASLADKTRLNDTFIVLHAGFVAALSKAIGVEFGAHFVERVVTHFDRAYELECQSQDSKVAANLTSLVATLYIFQVVTATLIFDFVRLFLQSVSETNTELLLLIVRSCGAQLRQDDPSSLKDIVAILHAAAAEVGEANLSVRTKFMIETVNNLKNNRAKAGATASAVVGEHITRMRKAIGSITSRKPVEPLRLGLADIRDANKKGKWWLVGASWKGEEKREESGNQQAASRRDGHDAVDDNTGSLDGEADLLGLAKTMGMNTEIRRAIFISIMSATDIKDADFRLSKLQLKKAQELEIPRVLIKCAQAEQIYNPYYALIAERLCTRDHRLQKAFRFSLWDLFKRFGERPDHGDETDEDEDDDDTEQSISVRQIVNLGKLFGVLIRKLALPITSLKILRFGMLRAKTASFLEVLFVTIFEGVVAHSKAERWHDSISRIFDNARLSPDMIPGQAEYLEELMRGEALKQGNGSKGVRQCCRLAVEELRRLAQDMSNGEL